MVNTILTEPLNLKMLHKVQTVVQSKRYIHVLVRRNDDRDPEYAVVLRFCLSHATRECWRTECVRSATEEEGAVAWRRRMFLRCGPSWET